MSLRYLAVAAALAGPVDPPDADNQPFWTGHPDAAGFERAVEGRLVRARGLLDRLTAATERRTVANTLVPYDQLMRELDRAASEASLIRNVHPDSTLRQAAERSDQRVSAFATDVSLDRQVFDAISAIELKDVDPITRHYLSRVLRDFRLAGVDQDSTTRGRIKALRDELVMIGQEFDRNVRDDVRKIDVASATELEGLPADFIAAHPPGPDGRIQLTTDYPDVFPVFTYARSDDLRRRVRAQFDNRAYPKNMAVLDRMIAKRDELARLLGFTSWADYSVADKMVQTAANASAFIDRVAAASKDAAEEDYQTLLRRKQQDDPGATAVNRWETAYLRELVRRSRVRLRLPGGAPLLPLRSGEARHSGPLGPAVRRHFPEDEGCPGVGSVGRGLGDAGGGQAGGAILPGHASAARKVRPRGALPGAHRDQRRRASGIGPGLQLLGRHAG